MIKVIVNGDEITYGDLERIENFHADCARKDFD